MELYTTGTGQHLRVHDRSKCQGQHCIIHNPSDHHMKDWPTHWRDDRGMMERICKCGVGHPDPDNVEYHNSIGDYSYGVHGCCGCCTKTKGEQHD